jgi:hypothetical protein
LIIVANWREKTATSLSAMRFVRPGILMSALRRDASLRSIEIGV